MKYVVFCGLLMFQSILQWEERAPMPLPRAGYMAGCVSKRLILAGGSYWENGGKHWSSRADFFDPSSGRWSEAPSMPEERSDAASVSVNSVLYVFGGGSGEVVRRDALAFENGHWQRLPAADLPAPRLYSVAVAVGSRIFLSGGIAASGNYSSASNDFLVWDSSHPERGWRTLPPVPGKPRFTHAMAAYHGRIYVFGGATAGGKDVQNLGDAYAFDTSTGVWARLPDPPVARRAWGSVVRGGDLFLVGGYTGTYEREVYRFDFRTGRLHLDGMLQHPYAAAIPVNVENSLVVTGGETADRIRAPWTLVALPAH